MVNLPLVHGEPSLILKNSDIHLAITPRGGHLAPVRFRIGKRWVEPMALAPWKPKDLAATMPPIIQVLRGDFFCLPFGQSRGVKNVHGETANGLWEAVLKAPGRLVLEMSVKNPNCLIQKTLCIQAGQRAIYQEHLIQGLQGRFNFGHHAILKFPEKGGPYHVNTSEFKFGQVKPEAFSNPLQREYGTLKTGAMFTSLDKVPLANGGVTSLQAYPARPGFDDLIMITSKNGAFAWTAATLDGYVWITLKDPRTLPSTLFWISNGGRHSKPWNGDHLGRLGLEEVCGYFSDGLDAARKNKLKNMGIPTTFTFKAKKSTSIRQIQVVHPIPPKFGMVVSITRDGEGKNIEVQGQSGDRLLVPVNWTFLN